MDQPQQLLPPPPSDPSQWRNSDTLRLLLARRDAYVALLNDSGKWGSASVSADGTQISLSVPTEKDPLCQVRASTIIKGAFSVREVVAPLIETDTWLKNKLDPGLVKGRTIQRFDDTESILVSVGGEHKRLLNLFLFVLFTVSFLHDRMEYSVAHLAERVRLDHSFGRARRRSRHCFFAVASIAP